jgi:hypothetical protein
MINNIGDALTQLADLLAKTNTRLNDLSDSTLANDRAIIDVLRTLTERVLELEATVYGVIDDNSKQN